MTRNWKNLIFKLVASSILVMTVLVSISDIPTGINIAICDEEVINNRTEWWGKVFVEHLNKEILQLLIIIPSKKR